MQSNKGRFKCPHEAQAVWNFYILEYKSVLSEFENDAQLFDMLTETAKNMHKSGLIHGTIYDEDGRIEDKDLAHELWLLYQESGWWFNNLDGHILDIVCHKKIRGTIFY